MTTYRTRRRMTQGECRALVHLLTLKEELAKLVALREERERKAARRAWESTLECTKAAVRTDGEPVYLDLDKKCRVVVS